MSIYGIHKGIYLWNCFTKGHKYDVINLVAREKYQFIKNYIGKVIFIQL